MTTSPLAFFYFYGLDPGWMVLTLVTGGIALVAQLRVKSTFAKYAQVAVRSGMTGAQAAAAVCRAGGVHDVTIEPHPGFLSDHYDPRVKALRLSPQVYEGRSISSIAVAAHEAGHAIQDVQDYAWLRFRSKMVPLASFGDRVWYIPFVLGIAHNMAGLVLVAVIAFALITAFHLVTLPMEFDASNRAKAVLAQTGIVSTAEEARGVEDVLGAAAMTYVAAALSSVLQLLYLLMRFANANNRGSE